MDRDEDKAMRARAAGKQEVAGRVVWELAVGLFRVRCVRGTGDALAIDGCALEVRTDKGWENATCLLSHVQVPSAGTALGMLRWLTSTNRFRDVVADRVQEIWRSNG